MLKRSLVVLALACGCSPAALSDFGAVPSTPSASRAPVAHEAPLVAARAPHARHARLAPPFEGSSVTRRVPDGEPMTAFAGTP